MDDKDSTTPPTSPITTEPSIQTPFEGAREFIHISTSDSTLANKGLDSEPLGNSEPEKPQRD